ncbi:MAG: hypothetical protein AAGF86_17505, partial [Pseudomonadota bacterium]
HGLQTVKCSAVFQGQVVVLAEPLKLKEVPVPGATGVPVGATPPDSSAASTVSTGSPAKESPGTWLTEWAQACQPQSHAADVQSPQPAFGTPAKRPRIEGCGPNSPAGQAVLPMTGGSTGSGLVRATSAHERAAEEVAEPDDRRDDDKTTLSMAGDAEVDDLPPGDGAPAV